MYMRLGFSVAMHVQPNILLLDEVLAVGDEAFQQKCFGRLGDFRRAGGTIVFVSHDPSAVERLCDRAIMLEAGQVLEEGPATDVVSAYHRRLVSSPAAQAARRDGAVATRCRVHEVRAMAGDGTVRDRFVEGEPMALEVWLYAEQELDGASVTVGIRDADGRPVGSQTLDGVRLPQARLERLRLNFPGLPMREGRFFVDVGVTTADRGDELALAERALELSVFGSDAAGSGPIRLGGTWEVPHVDGTGDG
jgi:ABC-2 type transport system ATP-binding protein